MPPNKTRGLALKGSCLHACTHHRRASHPATVPSDTRLTLGNLVDSTILVEVNVQPLGLEIHGLHIAFVEDAVLLGEVGLCESLRIALS